MSKLIKNTSLYAVGNILPKAVSFLLLPLYTRYLTPEDYGIVNSMQVLSTVLIVLFTLCIDRAIYRLYFDYKTEESKRDFLGTVTIGSLGISISVLIVLFICNHSLESIYKSIPFYPFYAFIIVDTFFLNFSNIPKIYFQLNEKASSFLVYSSVEFIITTTFTIIFVVWLKEGAIGMMKGSLISRIIVAPMFWRISYQSINFKFIPEILKKSVAFGLPGIPILLSSWIIDFSDRLFIEHYFSISDVGMYSLSFKIAGLSLIFSAAFLSAYSPIFYGLANSDNQDEAKKKLYIYNNLFMISIIIICFLVSLFSKEFILLFLDIKYAESYKVVPIISLAYLISQISGVFNLAIYQKKKVVQMVYIIFLSALVNIFSNFALVPIYGVFGAGYATVISFLTLFIVGYWYAKKCYFIPFNWPQLTFISLGCLGIFTFFYFFSCQNIILSLFLKFSVLFIIVIIFGKKYLMRVRSVFFKL